MRSRHPLLASRVEGEEFVYVQPSSHFSLSSLSEELTRWASSGVRYDSPANVEEALDQAKTSFEFHTDQLHSGEGSALLPISLAFSLLSSWLEC